MRTTTTSLEDIRHKLRSLGYDDTLHPSSAPLVDSILGDLQMVSKAYRNLQRETATSGEILKRTKSPQSMLREQEPETHLIRCILADKETELAKIKTKHSLEIENADKEIKYMIAELAILKSENLRLRNRLDGSISNKENFDFDIQVEKQRDSKSRTKLNGKNHHKNDDYSARLETLVEILNLELEKMKVEGEKKMKETSKLTRELSKLSKKIERLETVGPDISIKRKSERPHLENKHYNSPKEHDQIEIPSLANTLPHFDRNKGSRTDFYHEELSPAHLDEVEGGSAAFAALRGSLSPLDLVSSQNARLLEMVSDLLKSRDGLLASLISQKDPKFLNLPEDLGSKFSFSSKPQAKNTESRKLSEQDPNSIRPSKRFSEISLENQKTS